MKEKVIIFDFDGVLADSFDFFYSLNSEGMKHIGLSLTKKRYRDLFIGNIHQGFKDFINNGQKYPVFLKFKEENYDTNYYSAKNGVKLFSEAPAFLKKISKKYILTVASSGRQKNVKVLLKEKGVKNLFGLILADSSYSKEGMIKEILHKYQAHPGQTFFVTDTVGDLKTAKEFGLKTIAVIWGFHDKKTLMKAEPDYIASDFKKLISELNTTT